MLTTSLDHYLSLTFVSFSFLAVKRCYSNLLCDVILHFVCICLPSDIMGVCASLTLTQ